VGSSGAATYSSPFFVEEALVKKDTLRNVWDFLRFIDFLMTTEKGKGSAPKPLRKVSYSPQTKLHVQRELR